MSDIKKETQCYGVQIQQLKCLSKHEYLALKELSCLSKNIYNVALYNVRQQFFTDKTYLNYYKNAPICKTNENFKLLNSNSAQQIVKYVDRAFKSFFSLIKLAKQGKYNFKDIKLPRYLKKDGFFNLIFAEFNTSKDCFTVPMSPLFKKLYGKVNIKIPTNLKDKIIKEVRIIPKNNATFFELQWVYETQEVKGNLNTKNALSIDLGVSNLATCTTNNGNAFIIDGKKLKSINQLANKKNTLLQSIKDKQGIVKSTKAQNILWRKRNNKVNDYLNKTTSLITNYCLANDIGTLVLGFNKGIQKDISLGKSNNQNFVNIPIGKLKSKLIHKCKLLNIKFIEQEESYTSKSSFLDNDNLPNYSKENKITYLFSGKRISRGQYKSLSSVIINSDINGSLNIMRKANINNINLKCNEYLNPKRIRVV